MELNVIWIDDQCKEHTGFASTFISRCEKRYGIHISSFELAIEGMSHLEHNLDKYNAVILDAKGWHDKRDVATTTYGMHEAIKQIQRLAYKKYVPYYILTAQGDLVGDEEFANSVGKDKVYYKYNSNDIDKLLKQIEDDSKNNSRQQIRLFYHDALNILHSMNEDASGILLDILEAIHYPEQNSKFKPVLYYNQLRQILEYVFFAANKYQIIPDECFPKGKVNLDQCYRYLIGDDCEICEVRYGNIGESIAPKHIANMISMILYLGNLKSHYTKLIDRDREKINNYFESNVGRSQYVIYSLTFQVCEILIWMDKYITEHQNVVANSRNCKKLYYPRGVVESIDGITDFYHIGDKYCIGTNLVEKMGLAGRTVKVVRAIQNPNKEMSFQFEAKRVIP